MRKPEYKRKDYNYEQALKVVKLKRSGWGYSDISRGLERYFSIKISRQRVRRIYLDNYRSIPRAVTDKLFIETML